MCREPTSTPCAVLQKRSVWPGKETGRKYRASGQSLQITQNQRSHEAACKPHDPARASRDLAIFNHEPYLLQEFRQGRE